MNKMLLNHISETSTCGEDCKYEDSFLLIEQEIDNDTSVTQEKGTNWNFIVEKSEEFLINESKDLKIASWWLYGNYKNNSWNGLKNSLIIYIEMLNEFKGEMYPSSIRAKKNIFIWLEDTLSTTILNNIDSLQYGDEFYKLFLELNDIIQIILDTKEIFFGKASRSLEKYKKVVEKVVEKVESKPNKNSSNESINLNSNVTEITNDADATNLLREFKKYANLLTTYYRSHNFADVKASRINRLITWLDTEGIPFNENGTTYVQPPSILELDEMKEYINNEEYKQAFLLIEEIIEVSPFWIDGHYEAYKILEKTNNIELANEVKNSLISFITCNEGIIDLKFTDGSNFANKRTKDWINENLQNTTSSQSKIDENNGSIDIIKSAYELAGQNKINDAFTLLDNQKNLSTNEEEKFKWRLEKVKIALEFDKSNIALALLEELEDDINKYNLKQWNPKLSSEVYELLLNSFTNMEISNEKRDVLYKNLCITDICKALKIKL